MPTIKEVAAAAGVSRGTVDRVLHNRGGVKPDVANLIRETVDAMSYLPNRAGKVLAARKQPLTIGCFLSGIGNSYFDDVVRGYRTAESELRDFGVSLDIRSICGYDVRNHIHCIENLASSGCSALCISTIDVPLIHECVNKIIDSGIPIITVNTDLTNTNRLCYVGCNYLKGGSTAAGLLAPYAAEELSILIITGSRNIKGHNERISGFEHTLRSKHVPYHIVDIVESQDDDEFAYKTSTSIFQKNPEINCVYITAAGVAGVCRAISEQNLKQRGLHVITFDDTASTRELVNDGIIDFTIGAEPHRQGYKAVQFMFEYFMSGKKISPDDFLTETIIKINENL